MRAPTAFLMHSASQLHDTGWGHPEHQGRLRAIVSAVANDIPTLHGHVETAEPSDLAESVLLLAHTPEHVGRVRALCERAAASGQILELDADTKVSPATWDAAVGSVSAAVSAVRGVAQGRWSNAFVATRPPGHHASADRAMGFCLFDNVALAARWLQREGHAERVLIVDWDVHHGNGTQDVFWEDPSVFFLSLHQFPHWPGSGAADERGGGAGMGWTRNVPIAPATPRDVYLRAFEDAVDAAWEVARPDFVLVSAGFDCMAGDPLGDLLLEPEDLHAMTRSLVARAESACGGRVVALLEGGYNPPRTARGVIAVTRALAGLDPVRETSR